MTGIRGERAHQVLADECAEFVAEVTTPTPIAVHLAQAVISGNAAMLADLRDMAAGAYTGRHCEAWLAARGVRT